MNLNLTSPLKLAFIFTLIRGSTNSLEIIQKCLIILMWTDKWKKSSSHFWFPKMKRELKKKKSPLSFIFSLFLLFWIWRFVVIGPLIFLPMKSFLYICSLFNFPLPSFVSFTSLVFLRQAKAISYLSKCKPSSQARECHAQNWSFQIMNIWLEG